MGEGKRKKKSEGEIGTSISTRIAQHQKFGMDEGHIIFRDVCHSGNEDVPRESTVCAESCPRNGHDFGNGKDSRLLD